MDKINALKILINNIYTDKIIFREMVKSDIFPLYQATKHEDFNRHLLWEAPTQELELLPEVEKLLRDNRLNKALLVAICEKDTAAWVGFAKFAQYSTDGVEVSLWLNQSISGKTNTIVQAMIEMILEKTDAEKIYLRIIPDNTKAMGLAARLNFVKVDQGQDKKKNGEIVNFDVLCLERSKQLQSNVLKSY